MSTWERNFHCVSRESAGRILAVVVFSFGLVFLPLAAWPSLAWMREYVYMLGFWLCYSSNTLGFGFLTHSVTFLTRVRW
jgi:hypothetical protein